MSKSFDVFLSHNSKDKAGVRELAEALRSRGLEVWLDEWELIPGRPWQKALEEVIETTRSAAVLVGKDGLGPWQDAEMQGCLSEFATRQLPVIPVLLPGVPEVPKLPIFLKRFTWVDLRKGLTEEGIESLQWGVTGKRPVAMSRADPNEPQRFNSSSPPNLSSAGPGGGREEGKSPPHRSQAREPFNQRSEYQQAPLIERPEAYPAKPVVNLKTSGSVKATIENYDRTKDIKTSVGTQEKYDRNAISVKRLKYLAGLFSFAIAISGLFGLRQGVRFYHQQASIRGLLNDLGVADLLDSPESIMEARKAYTPLSIGVDNDPKKDLLHDSLLTINDGAYLMNVEAHEDQFLSKRTLSSHDYHKDSLKVLSADVKPVGEFKNAASCIFFRKDLGFCLSGREALIIKPADIPERWLPMSRRTLDSALHSNPAIPNKLTAICEGKTIICFVNNLAVYSEGDSKNCLGALEDAGVGIYFARRGVAKLQFDVPEARE